MDDLNAAQAIRIAKSIARDAGGKIDTYPLGRG